MTTETVYTTGKSSTNARINIGSGAASTADGQIAFPDECTSIKLVGVSSHADGSGTLVIVDSNGIIKKAGGSKTTIAALTAAAAQTALGTVYGFDAATSAGNVMYGYNAGPSMSSSTQRCTGMGSGALALGGLNTTWSDSAFGYNALGTYTSGNWNSGFGSGAGATLTGGNGNTFIGTGADTNAGTSNNRIAIGYTAVAKNDNEFAIAPTITQIRAEGLSNITPKGYSKMMYDATNKIMRPMSGGDFWAAEVQTEYTQSLTSGSGSAFIGSLIPLYGSTSSWLSGGDTITIPSGFPNLGIWEATVSAYVTTTSSATAMSLEILRGATVFARYETVISSTQWISRGGTRLVQLTPGQTIQMRLNWTTSGATTSVIKPNSTYIHLKFIGLGSL
jgi:hypothetical protein